MPDHQKIQDERKTALVLTGEDLTLEHLAEVSREERAVELSEGAKEALCRSRALVNKIIEEKRVAYGITTGFGGLSGVAVPEREASRLSTNLVLSHATGTGEPFSREQVRGMMLLRLNALCRGYSGVRPELAEKLRELLNAGVTPFIPEKGSLGASGDLAPLSHMGLVLLGKGKAYYKDQLYPGKEALQKAGIQPLEELSAKEGLGLTNGTCAMTSVGGLHLYDVIRLEETADLISALSFTALTGQLSAFDERVHEIRGQAGQKEVARLMRELTRGSALVEASQGLRVQDAYSLRCIPQVHGAVRDSLSFIRAKVETELNAVTDNPLIFPDDEAVISGGNFHGEPMALVFDYLGIACAELASISERRLERMVNHQLSNGLPPFLATESGLNSGYMIVQYAAASMVSDNKVLAHPSSVDSIPSSANQEDFVSMGTGAARKAGHILENTRSVLAYELLTACQAVELRLKEKHMTGKALSPALRELFERVREGAPFMEKDRELWPDIEYVEKLIRSNELVRIVRTHAKSA